MSSQKEKYICVCYIVHQPRICAQTLYVLYQSYQLLKNKCMNFIYSNCVRKNKGCQNWRKFRFNQQSLLRSSRFPKDTILTLPMMNIVPPTKFCTQNIVSIFSLDCRHTQKKRNNSCTKFGWCKQSVLQAMGKW